MATQVDLTQLATTRKQTGPPPHSGNSRVVWLTRYVVPIALLAGFAGTLAFAFRESFVAATPVTVIPVVAAHAEIHAADAPLFQSAGWVEPRPTPVVVSALDEGVVERLFVIEGQEVKDGEVVAQLIETDAKLRLLRSEAELKSRQAELASSQAALAAAEVRLREPLELQTRLAEAEAMLAKTESDLARLPSQLQAAKQRFELAEKEKESRTQSAEGISKLALARTISEFHTAAAAVAELEAQRPALENEFAAHQRRVAGLKRQLELKTEERRQHEEAQAAVALAEAQVQEAQVNVDAAMLSLSRMKVRAPIAGKVLSLVARPGGKVMGLAPATPYDASTVITMYDPAQLQIRADVRLEDVPKVSVGQQVRIETAAVDGPLSGVVIAATSLTDIQKNTLQVKVSIDSPPPVLKPDMLVQVTFLSPPSKANSGDAASNSMTIAIPPQLIHQDGQASTVWIADRERAVATRRTVTLGGTTTQGMRQITSGLSIGDRIIATGGDSVKEGDRIQITEEVDSE